MRLTALDGMRGAAALMVAAYHVDEVFSGGAPWIGKGYLAVDFFFVLSGFVIALTYDRRMSAGMSAGEFMARRFLRVTPLYWIGCLLGALALIGTAGVSALPANLLFLPTWHDGPGGNLFTINPPGWSLFFELLVANLAFGLFWRRLNDRTVMVLVAVSAVALAFSVRNWGRADVGFTEANFLYGFPRVLFSFFVGVQLCRWRERLPTVRVPALALAAILVASLLPTLGGRVGAIYDLACIFFLFPAIVHMGAYASELRPRVGFMLGEVSYALYAIHFPLAEMLAAHGRGWHPIYQIPIVAAFGLIAWAMVRMCDAPLQRRFSEFWRVRRAMSERGCGG